MLTIHRLDLEEAHIIIEGAAIMAREIGVPMCIAVTDEGGHLVTFDRMDGAKISSIAIAIDKAFTGATARKSTEEYNRLCVPGEPTFGIHVTNGGRFSVIGGGLPIIVDGNVIGGVGVSAGTASQDVVCAQAAIDHFLEKTGYVAAGD